MSYTALYRKYRPNNFQNVVGQDVIVNLLKNTLKTKNISHAYLFTGPRGTGKTSVAKIFAHAVNCENFLDDICGVCESCKYLDGNDTDIIEIDAASNNGVDEIRTIRDNVTLLPSFCKYKIYIIDEVHMLSTGAFNALLKTLEEPPAHIIFILATTEPNKIPVTILSRCQRYDFNRINNDSLFNRLKYILNEENKNLDDEIINYIAKLSQGGLRDAINLLDQILSLNIDNVTIEVIDDLCGVISRRSIVEIFKCLCTSDYVALLDLINDFSEKGKKYSEIVTQMIIFLRDYSISKEVENYFEDDYFKILTDFTFSSEIVIELSRILNELLTSMKSSNDQKLLFEIYILHLIKIINKKNNILTLKLEKDDDRTTFENPINSTEKIIDSLGVKETDDIIEDDKDSKEESILDFEKLKKIRINNVLFGANKEILNSILDKYNLLEDYLSNKTYNSYVVLLNDAKVVVASNEYLLFSFNNDSSVSVFDKTYKQLELFLNMIFEHSYKIVSVTNNEWQIIREEFILNKKNNIPYVFINENDVKLDVTDSFTEMENVALDIFGEDTVSVK